MNTNNHEIQQSLKAEKLVPEITANKIVLNFARPNLIENLRIEVGAGFIPARSSNRGGLRAGINPAPTNKG